MASHPIHPNWDLRPEVITDGYSLEMTAKDLAALGDAAPLIAAETPVAVTFLPGEDPMARVAAARRVRELGFEPMPHFSARRILSPAEFEDYLGAVVEQAGVRRCFVVAGDPPEPLGPYNDSSALIESGAFERAGITAIGIGGHPEGHPVMAKHETWAVLDSKIDAIQSRGMAALIVTQFAFDPDAMMEWVLEARRRGIDVPIRLGVPGPTSIKALLRFATRCGVGASASVMKKYGVSITNLLGSAGPDKLVDAFAQGLTDAHGPVRLHFYPFGGLSKTLEWINTYRAKNAA